MNGIATLLLTLALLGAAATGTAAAAGPTATETATTTTATATDERCVPADESEADDAETTPGQHLAGVVGAQQSEVTGEIDGRGLEARLANASTTEERAAVIAAEVERIDARLAALEERCRDLAERRENGSIGEGEYRTRAGTLGTRADALACHANRTAERAEPLPDDVRDEYDIDNGTFAALDERIAGLRALNATADGDDSALELAALGIAPERSAQSDECGLPTTDDGGD